MFGDRVWKLKQNAEEILYQVCGRRGPNLANIVKTEPYQNGEVCGVEKRKSGKVICNCMNPGTFYPGLPSLTHFT